MCTNGKQAATVTDFYWKIWETAGVTQDGRKSDAANFTLSELLACSSISELQSHGCGGLRTSFPWSESHQ